MLRLLLSETRCLLLTLQRYNIPISHLYVSIIFSVGLRVLGGAPTPEEFNVSKYVRGVKLRAQGTGELTSSSLKLDATIKCVDKLKTDGTDGAGGTNGEQTQTGDPAMGGEALS